MTPEKVSEKPEYELLRQAVLALPEKYRLPIHLYYYEEYSVREIAEILQRKESAVQTQLQRGREKIRRSLTEKGVSYESDHESYEKAFSNITLDDRIGMELLSNAKVKRLRRKKKITSQVAAAIICLVLAGGAGTGICYCTDRNRSNSLFCNDVSACFCGSRLSGRRWFCRK